MKSIIKCSCEEAKEFFLNEKAYSTLNLPQYFTFQKVLDDSIEILKNRKYKELFSTKKGPRDFEGVNYSILSNKKDNFDWRRIELIHPIIYVELVNTICNEKHWNLLQQRFNKFSSNESIECCSIPVNVHGKKASIKNWWNHFEQRIISKSLDYKCMAIADIQNCYPSIYTHSVAWAVNGKANAKKNRGNGLLGNKIDNLLQDMNNGQTNGIPTGSVLMDFIAELVLGYSDMLLKERLSDEDGNYYILRYRDDYRIFCNNHEILEKVISQLADVLMGLNFRLNPIKTEITDDILNNSIKKDKAYSLLNPFNRRFSPQKHLMAVYLFSKQFPNSGSVRKELNYLFTKKKKWLKNSVLNREQLIAILSGIMFYNTSTYIDCVGLISIVLEQEKNDIKENYINRISEKFNHNPFSDYLDIWLQRLTVVIQRDKYYESIICQKIYINEVKIWNSEWITEIDFNEDIIDLTVLENVSPTISDIEIDSFDTYEFNE